MKSPLGIDICLELSKTLYQSLWNCKSQKSPTAFPQNCPSDPRRANVPSSPKPLSIKGTFSNPAISGGLFWPLSGEVVEQLWIYVFCFCWWNAMNMEPQTDLFMSTCWFVWSDYFFVVVSRYFLYILFFGALLGEQIRIIWIYFGMLSVANKGDCNWQRFLRPTKYPPCFCQEKNDTQNTNHEGLINHAFPSKNV